MSDSFPDNSALPNPQAIVPAAGPDDAMVKLARYATADEAQVAAMVLNAQGIPAYVLGENSSRLNWFWQGFNDVELHVRSGDVHQAVEILNRATYGDLEPAEEIGVAATPVDERGRVLVPVAAYDNIAALRDARDVLASQGIRGFVPMLEPRGDRPVGHGKRFLLRVAEEEMEAAESLLQEEADDAAAEPRCPACGSWRTYAIPAHWKTLLSLVGLASKPAPEMECLACRHRGDAAAFIKA